jgi:hypothetical protein
MTQQLDMIRKLFLEKQLTRLPVDVINIIRDYDYIHREHFTKVVLNSLSDKVYNFWHNKMINYEKIATYGDYNFLVYKKIHDYYYILFNVIIIPPININPDDY